MGENVKNEQGKARKLLTSLLTLNDLKLRLSHVSLK